MACSVIEEARVIRRLGVEAGQQYPHGAFDRETGLLLPPSVEDSAIVTEDYHDVEEVDLRHNLVCLCKLDLYNLIILIDFQRFFSHHLSHPT